MRRIIVSLYEGLLTRAAVFDDDRLLAFLREVHGRTRPVGQIHLGEIIRDVRGTNGAFVELADGAKGFLEQNDILAVTTTKPHPPAFIPSKSGSTPVAQLPPPQTRLIVQVKRESASGKLVQLTTDVSLAGKLVVLRPYRPIRRITKALKGEAERDALHDTLRSIKPPGKAGVIVRTAGRSAPESALKAEVEALAAMWERVVQSAAAAREPCLLFKEPELIERLVRDDLGMEDTEIIADSPAAVARLKEALRASADASRVTLKHHRASLPIFHALHIEKEIENLYNRELSLPSGGNIVIEYTEAMITVDVNSGAARGEADVFRTNFEAANTLFRHLQLRDMGGLIACNFLGMREARNRKALEERLRTLAAEDRGNVWVGDISPLGVAVLTRRTDGSPAAKLGLVRCPRCGGPGLIADDVSAAAGFLDALRLKGKTKTVTAKVSPRVLAILANSAAFEQVKTDFGKKLVLEESPCDAAADYEVR